MPKKSVSIEIDRPVEDVFDFVATHYFENYPKWSPRVLEIQKLSDGPTAMGTVGRQRRESPNGVNETTIKVTDFTPNRTFAIETTGVGRNSQAYNFAPTAAGTQLTISVDREMKGLQRFIAPPGAGQNLQRIAAEYVQTIKALLEER